MAAKLEMKTVTICIFVLVCASFLPNCQCQAESDSELDTESQTTSYSSNSVMEFIKATEVCRGEWLQKCTLFIYEALEKHSNFVLTSIGGPNGFNKGNRKLLQLSRIFH